MKTISRIFTTLALLAICQSLGAVVASPIPFKYTQPDGTVITLQMHGDEFNGWVTCNGTVVQKGSDGFYRPATLRPATTSIPGAMTRQNTYFPVNANISNGSRKFLTILIEFSDLPFTVDNPHESFHNLLNQESYSQNNATGSVYDYYRDNSNGLFDPSFDVYGPVTLPKSYQYYGQRVGETSDAHADEALYDACCILHETTDIDFSQYDNDNDGYVDGVFFFFAGNNEAEGGGEDKIWPHSWSLHRHYASFDGVRVYAYACTSEYKGTEKIMCGIGTFCHEFGHTLGLPDFYDTDYESNGSSENVYNFSTWGNGNYNNGGKTPPAMSSFEKELLGWGEIPTWTSSAEISLKPVFMNGVSQSSGKTLTSVDGEYFYYESRGGGNVWDAYLPARGMLIYHVDKSISNSSKWSYNKINAYASHPCYYLKKAGSASQDFMPFPGEGNVTQFYDAKEWSGKHTGVYLSNIQYNSITGVTRFKLEFDSAKKIVGTVTDNDGNPLANAKIAITVKEPSLSPAAAKSPQLSAIDLMSAAASADYTTTTESDGTFMIEIDTEQTQFTLYAVKSGYYAKAYDLQLLSGRCIQDVTLYPRSDDKKEEYTLRKYKDETRRSGLGWGSTPCSIMGAVMFTADELTKNAGDTLAEVSFQIGGNTADAVFLIVDFGKKRMLWQEVGNVKFGGMNTVNIKDKGLVIPEKEDICIGYAIQNSDYSYPLAISSASDTPYGCMYSGYYPDYVGWYEYSGFDILISAKVSPFDPSTEPEFPGTTVLNRAGFNVIDAKPEYSAGETYEFKIIESIVKAPTSVKWHFDGEETSQASVVLSPGVHVIEAHLSFADGSASILRHEINVR